MAKELSERQQKIMAFLQEFISENRFPPTIRQIGEDVGISSTSVVKYNLDVLEKKNLIERDREISRGIRLVADRLTEGIRVPLLGFIVASEPFPVPESDFALYDEEHDSVELTRDIVKDARDVFALKVQGDSMIDALIYDGDVVLMRSQERVENGELAAVWLPDEGEATLKRFYLEGEQVRLQPENPTMKPMFFPAKDVEIQGKVVCVIRQLN